ncbi:myosin heavy chain, fast skeletal muscle-like isoform X5 [Macrobrachium nipponense]|uniref:myosin heavy chain, fast skeletal muscle-like isoform X5 n=1 Tax=Macrobrachium nipponense TaxID=159736 RepID=UPI0030C82BF2
MAKVETLKAKIAEVELIGDELELLKPSDQTGTPRHLAPLNLRSNNKTERDITNDAINFENGKDIKPVCTFQEMPPSSPLHNQQEPSVKPKLGKTSCTESQSSFSANTPVNSDNVKITESLSVSVSNEPTSNSDKMEKESAHVLSGKRNDFNKKTAAVAGQFDTRNNAEGEGKSLSSVEKPFNAVKGSIHVSTSGNDTPSADASVSSKSKEPSLFSVNETSLTKNIYSSVLDQKNTPAGIPASSENCAVDSGIMSNDLPLYKDGARNLKEISVGISVNKDVTDKTKENSLPKQPAEQASQSVPSSHKVRSGSPVPNKKASAGIKVTAPVVTGKLQITPNSGPGPPMSCKESTGLDEKDRDGSDSAVSKKHIAEVPAVLTSKTEANNAAENLSINDDVAIGDEAMGTKTLNGVLEDCELRNVAKNKVQSALPDQSLLQVNGIRIADIADDKEDVDNDFSEIETFVDRSRCSSVASDTSRTISPDISQRTGIRKPKGEKLSAMMNLWESEDASQVSEKSKMKQPLNKPKVGKISGIKNLFESGKAAEKPEILNNPNLVKLRSASGAALVDPKSTPNLHKKIVPGASGIASINAAKFGGTSKFKKPSECPPSAGDKILKKVKSNLSEDDVKRNVSSQKEKNSVANNQKDLSNVISKELKELSDGNSSSDNNVISNNQKNLDSVVSFNNQNTRDSDDKSSEKIEKTVEKDKCLGSNGDTGIKEKPLKDTREVKLEKEESSLKVENDMNVHNSKTAENKAPDFKNAKCSKDVPNNINESDIGVKAVNVAHDGAEPSLLIGESMKKDVKKKKKKNKDTNSEDPDEKGKCQVDTNIVKVENLLDAVDGKPNMVSCTAITSNGVKVACTTSECSKTESNSDDAKAGDITKENVIVGKDASIDQGTSSTGEQSIDNFESKFKGSKTLGGIKSFIIESVAKGGKTLEDKLSKTGIPLGKKSAKSDYQKDSLMPDCKTKKRISAFDIKVSANAGSALSNNENIKPAEDLGKSKSDYKQSVMNCIPALESEVDAITKEASSFVEPVKRSPLPSYLVPKLELASKPLQSVASFPDTPMGGEFCITSLPASPTEEKKNFEFVDKHKILSLPASPTKEVHFNFEETSEEEEVFVDAIDPGQLDTLMPLPDVQSERDIRSRSRTPMDYRERSVTPSPLIAESEAILSETDRLLRRSRSNKSLRRSYSRSLSNAALNRLSEVTADLSEEHTTAHLAGERLEAEQAERMKLEKEIDRLQTDVKRMTTANGKLEMEKLVLRSEVLSAAELNGDMDDDEAADASLYKRKYEWCLREIELLKKQSKQQQEDDLDQLLLLKKQLEKKVGDAYEETDEQRQVVAQLKRKCQRLQAEMNDLKILLEEQTSRNNLLEKKQRKFDQEVMSVQEELRHERGNKDKIQRERDQILSEKYSFEQEVTTLKLELELKEEKVAALNRELDDLTSSGKVEEEVATLKKAKHDLELRIKDQEEELDDLAGQVQMLEGAKVRLEMSMEQMRKENRREISQREEELEEIRLSAQKKVKSLEAQLENEHEERTLLVREKHELERRITDLQDRTITHVDEDYVHKLKKELKKTKALLRDTQTMLEKAQSEGSHKLILRQLKTQLEDAEFAKTAALKARQCAESDLADVSSQLDEALRAKKESEDKCARVNKEKAEIQTQIEESEEELAEVMKKYKAVVSQLSVDQITLSEQSQQIAELEHSKQVLQERMMELSSKVEVLEGETANIHTQRRLEMKIKEIESKLELELTTRQRLESQIGRLKDQIERLSGECDAAKMKESQALDQSKRLTRQLRDAKEDLSNMQQRYTEAVNKKSELEKQLELSDAEVATLKSDLKLAFKRIEDLQQAIQGDISDSDSELSDSDSDSDGSLSSYLTASLKHQRSSSNSTLRTPPSEVHQLERLELPNSPCSEAMSAISEDLDDTSNKESFA